MHESARPATTADGPELRRLVTRALDDVAGQRGAAAWLATRAPAPPATPDGWLVGCLDDVPVGAAFTETVAWPDGRSVVEIRFLYVEPEARELAVGEALVDAVLDAARQAGAYAVESTALPGDRELKNLFERFGLVARAITVHKALDGA